MQNAITIDNLSKRGCQIKGKCILGDYEYLTKTIKNRVLFPSTMVFFGNSPVEFSS